MKELQAIFDFLNEHDKRYHILKYLSKHCHSIKQKLIIIDTLDATSNINIEYLCKLPMAKLYKVAKQHKVRIKKII